MAAAESSSSLRSAAGAGSCTTSNDHLLYHPESISLLCSDGIILTGQSYKKQSTCGRRCRRQRRILCLHGWMDNCRSYYYLAPHLLERIIVQQKNPTSTTTEKIDENDTSHQEYGEDNADADADDCRTDRNDDVHVVALDFPGHGQSSHFGPGRPGMVLAELIVYVAEALRALGWTTHHGGANGGSSNGGEGGGSAIDATKNFTLIGHSMGAAVACLYAAAFPEQIDQLVLLEGVGPLARPALDTAKHVRKHVEKRLLSPTLYAEPRRYESLALAITARCRTARTWPGNQYLSEVAARQLVEYGTRKTTTIAAATKQQQEPVTTSNDDNDDGTSTTTYYQFRHDPRLQWPSLQFFTPEQTDGVYQDIQCPTALILAADGWPFDETIRRRTIELLRPVYTVTLPGSHHWHMDPDTAPAVVEHVAQFLSRDP